MNETRPAQLRAGFWQLIGGIPEPREDGHGRVRLPVTPHLLRGGGDDQPVHGGVVMSLADMAAVQAARSTLRPGEQLGGTAEMNISFLRPTFGGELIGEARVLKKGRMLAVCDVDVIDDQGRLVAKARASFAVLADGARPDTDQSNATVATSSGGGTVSNGSDAVIPEA